MEKRKIESIIEVYSYEELTEADKLLVDMSIDSTNRSYSPYSHFCVGAAVLLDDGTMIHGCNQENAAYGVTMCAERSALFTAGASFPDKKVVSISIAAKDEHGQLLEEPVTPCGSCRQALIEAETRYGHKISILLYGTKHIYKIDGIGQLMPLSFSTYS